MFYFLNKKYKDQIKALTKQVKFKNKKKFEVF
jgi:hypothetical protein